MTEAGSALEEAASAAGLQLVTRGIDPMNPIEAYPLAVGSERYLRLAAHLATLGPAGGRMMRQTSSIQVNVSWGEDPLEEWTVANRAAPYLLAVFANSPRYEGAPTGHRSARAWQWRSLDPMRTGIPLDASDPVEAYLRFALGAGAILLGESGADVRPFAEWVQSGCASMADWEDHLSTLFPEVRPRGYLELRGLDALPIRWWTVPLTILAGLLVDPVARREALESLGPPSGALLERAGREGLGDPEIRAGAEQLWELALAGISRLDAHEWGELEGIALEFEETVGRMRPSRSTAAPGDSTDPRLPVVLLGDPGALEEQGDPSGPVPLSPSVRSVR
jgi:glutamate--cysteine ligase